MKKSIIFIVMGLVFLPRLFNGQVLSDSTEACFDMETVAATLSCLRGEQNKYEREIKKYNHLLLQNVHVDTKEQLENSQNQWEKWKEDEFKYIDNIYGQRIGEEFILLRELRKRDIIKARAVLLKEHFLMLNDI